MQQITALHKAIDNLRSHATELLQRYKQNDNITTEAAPGTPEVSREPSSSSSSFITNKDILTSTPYLGAIKSTNRAVTLKLEEAQQYVEKASNAADANHLLLQNLLYEKAHLIREIQKCTDYPTPELDRIHFVSLNELAAMTPELQTYRTDRNHPQDVPLTPQDFNLSEHKLNHYRLNHELQLRKQMEGQVEEQKQKLTNLRQILSDKRAILESIPNYIKDYEKMITPLATKLGMDNSNTSSLIRYNRVIQLPRPLYTLYNQIDGLIQLTTIATELPSSIDTLPSYIIDTTDAVVPMIIATNDSSTVSRITIPIERYRLYSNALGLSSSPSSSQIMTFIDASPDTVTLPSNNPSPHPTEASIGRKRPRTEDSSLPHKHHTSTHHYTTTNDSHHMEEMDGFSSSDHHHSSHSSLLFEETGAPMHEAQYISLPLTDAFRPHPHAVMLGIKLSNNTSSSSSTGTVSSSSSLSSVVPSPSTVSIVGIRFQFYPLLDIVTATPVGAGDAGAVTVQSMFQKHASNVSTAATTSGTGTTTTTTSLAVTFALANVPHNSLINLNSSSDSGKWDSRYIQLCAIGNDTPTNSTTILSSVPTTSSTPTGTLSSPSSGTRKHLLHLTEHDMYASKVVLPLVPSKNGEGAYYWIHSLTGTTPGIPPPHYMANTGNDHPRYTLPSVKTIVELLHQRLTNAVSINTQLGKLTRNPGQLMEFVLNEFRSTGSSISTNNLYNYCSKLVAKLQNLQKADISSLHKIGGETLADLQPLLPLVTNLFNLLGESSIRYYNNHDQLASITTVNEVTSTIGTIDDMDNAPSRIIHILYSFTIPKGTKPGSTATTPSTSTSTSNAYIALTFVLILHLPIGFPLSKRSITAKLIPLSATNVSTPGSTKAGSSSSSSSAVTLSSIKVPSTPSAITMAQTMGASLLANLDIAVGGVTKKEEIPNTLQKFINLWCLSLPLFTSSSASVGFVFPHSLYALTYLLPSLLYTTNSMVTNTTVYGNLVKQFFTGTHISAMDSFMSNNGSNELPVLPSFHHL